MPSADVASVASLARANCFQLTRPNQLPLPYLFPLFHPRLCCHSVIRPLIRPPDKKTGIRRRREKEISPIRSPMDKRNKLKQRFTQMLLRSSCATTTTSTTAALVSLSKNSTNAIHHCATPPRRHVRTAPVVQVSIECGGGGRRSFDDANQSRRSERRVPHDAKFKAKKILPNAYGFSTSSSAESDTELGLFSSCDERDEREEETRTLFSSMSFSSDSSEFYYYRNPSKKKTHHKKPSQRRSSKSSRDFSPLVSISQTEKKQEKASKPARVAESGFAVVKKSSDPYKDFKSSMVEMIVEQGMSSFKDMERLLQSYLELNSPHHHGVILAAFTDIWGAIFGKQ